MKSDEPASVTAIKDLLTQAKRLRLVQQYRPATVIANGTPNATQVLVDGDTQAQRAVSLIGRVGANARVMTMTVAPEGLFIIGFYGVTTQPTLETFATPGTNRWQKPTGLKYAIVEGVGGGGGGGGVTGGAASTQGEGGGGGGGGYFKKLFLASEVDDSVSFNVGAGGGGGANGASNGTTGGSTTFDSCTAVGGTGGTAGGTSTAGTAYADGGAGGTASGGDINISGSKGSGGRVLVGAAVILGRGGDSQKGAGAAASASAGGNGNNGSLYGGGGSGAFATTVTRAGGTGASGIVIVTSYFA